MLTLASDIIANLSISSKAAACLPFKSGSELSPPPRRRNESMPAQPYTSAFMTRHSESCRRTQHGQCAGSGLKSAMLHSPIAVHAHTSRWRGLGLRHRRCIVAFASAVCISCIGRARWPSRRHLLQTLDTSSTPFFRTCNNSSLAAQCTQFGR